MNKISAVLYFILGIMCLLKEEYLNFCIFVALGNLYSKIGDKENENN